jgi:hypothetical protein
MQLAIPPTHHTLVHFLCKKLINHEAEACKAHGDKMVSIMHALPVFGCSPLRVSISIREGLKVVITLGEDPHNSVEITLQPIPQPALYELER